MSVTIVGGDMVDATLVLVVSQLSHGTLPVHLIEASKPETGRHPGFDARAIALAAETCQQPARIGVWQAIADCATAIKTIHVSDRGHVGFVILDTQEHHVPALGQVVGLHDVELRLLVLLRKVLGVTLRCPDRVASVSCTQGCVEVALENGETITNRLLVAADGTRPAPVTACGVD